MLKNFIKTAIRFLWRNKTYTLINYLSLTFGLACTIVAVLNITRVLDYDKFNLNYDRLYEVEANVSYFNGDRFPKELLSASLTELIKGNIAGIELLAKIVNHNHKFINGGETFSENGIYADPDFLSIFSFPLVRGSAESALSDINSMIISERMAIKFFKTTDCVGRTLNTKDEGGQEVFTISGVMKDIPSQSYLQEGRRWLI